MTEVLKVYGDLEVPLEGKEFARLINQIDRMIDPEWCWRRNSELEERVTHGSYQMYCYAFDGGRREVRLPEANLWLSSHDGRATVSNIVPAKITRISRDEYNGILRLFHDELLRPASQSLGLEAVLSKTEVALEDMVDPDTARRLRGFSAGANKSTGSSHPMDEKRWFDFVISHHVRGDALSVELLQRWLVGDGWDEEAATELAIQFEQGRDLLRQYDEEREG